MIESVLERVRGEVSGERALESVRRIAGFHRVQSSPGYDAAAGWLCGELERAGLAPVVDQVAGDGRTRALGCLVPQAWECTHAEAWLVDGAGGRERLCDYGEQKLSLVLRSAPAAGRFPLVSDGVLSGGGEVRGAVVLTEGAVQAMHERAVLGRGAAGLLSYGRRLVPPVRTADSDLDSVAYTSFWWSEHAERGWGFVLSPRRGRSLRERLRAGEPLALEVRIESRCFDAPVPLVSAHLPGAGGPDVLVVSHLCHPQPSANDNASGAAANLEAARALASLRRSGVLGAGRLGIRFLWVPEITGTHAWLAHDPARARGLAAALNLDMVGERQDDCGSVFLLEHPPCFAASFAEELVQAIRERAVDWISSYSGPGHYGHTRMAEVPYGAGSDHGVLCDPAVGVPCPMLIQWPDRYYHSSLDTPDRTDPASLALAARTAAAFAAIAADGSDATREGITGLVARGARRRLLRALDGDDAARLGARERVRGDRAIASLARIGVRADAIGRAAAAWAAFAHAEAGPAAPGIRADAERVPRRNLAAPLHSQRFLLAGWDTLPAAGREAWIADEADTPDGALLADIAWSACDGRRTLAEIVELVRLESGRQAPEFIERFFGRVEGLGLLAWSAPAGRGREDAT